MDIFEELGVTAYINANAWYTSQGGSMLAAPVIEAMAEVANRSVRLSEQQTAVGEGIAKLTNNEAACVTSCATAAIVLAVAAFMSDLDPVKSERLPDTTGLKNEVILHKCDHFGEDQAIRIPGARVVEIGTSDATTEQDLIDAITPKTAAFFTTPPRDGMLPIEHVIQICHERGVSVIVDNAWALPPKENLWRFTRDLGADVVIVSGGKGLRGPQSSGLVLGRREIVSCCQAMSAPHCRIGRPMKVGKDSLVGIYAAVKHFMNGGAEHTFEMTRYIANELADIPGITIKIDESEPHVYVELSKHPATRDQLKAKLMEQEPRITVRDAGPNAIRINAGTLSEGHEEIVAHKLKAALMSSLQDRGI